MKCPKCGLEVDSQFAFCPACGEAFAKEEKPVEEVKVTAATPAEIRPDSQSSVQVKVESKKTALVPVIIAVVVTAIVTAGICFLAFGKDDGGKDNNSVIVNVEGQSETKAEEGVLVELGELQGTVQTFEGESRYVNAQIKSARLVQNSEGVKSVIVTYVYTNLRDKAEHFTNECDLEVYQNGVALERAYSSALVGYETKGDASSDVKPGASSEIELGYVLNDDTTPLLVEIRDDWDYDDYVFARTFYLN